MSLLSILILAIVQGLAELLPVSSSAHVIVAEKLLGLDPSKPEMTLLLVMLHTGTMFAVIVYFWRAWRDSIFASRDEFMQQAGRLFMATLFTVCIGVPLILGIEKGAVKFDFVAKDASGHAPKAEIEMLFSNLGLISCALAAGGVLILIAGLLERRAARNRPAGILSPEASLASVMVNRKATRNGVMGLREAVWMGAIQGICLPFRGFSRSGATISVGMLLGAMKPRVEEFSFAMAVIITPAAVGRMVLRLIKAQQESGNSVVSWSLFAPSLLGMIFAFLAGLVALKWLSKWLEGGRWYLFGIYCLVAATAVFALYCMGY
jgi:undecaprenyl-diphosphatase